MLLPSSSLVLSGEFCLGTPYSWGGGSKDRSGGGNRSGRTAPGASQEEPKEPASRPRRRASAARAAAPEDRERSLCLGRSSSKAPEGGGRGGRMQHILARAGARVAGRASRQAARGRRHMSGGGSYEEEVGAFRGLPVPPLVRVVRVPPSGPGRAGGGGEASPRRGAAARPAPSARPPAPARARPRATARGEGRAVGVVGVLLLTRTRPPHQPPARGCSGSRTRRRGRRRRSAPRIPGRLNPSRWCTRPEVVRRLLRGGSCGARSRPSAGRCAPTTPGAARH